MKSRRIASGEQREFEQLRKKAERLITNRQAGSQIAVSEAEALFHELQVHQMELEMQNDELRITNEMLERERIRFSSIYDLAPVGYLIVDKSGIVKEVNNVAMTLLEISKPVIVNKRLQSFISSEYSDEFYRFFKRLITSESRQNCYLEFVTHNQKRFYAQVEGIAISGSASAQLQCFIGIIDITQRREAEQHLAEIKERLELALEASDAGTWEFDLKTGQIYLDESNYRICGLNKENFDGNYFTFLQVIYEDDRAMVDEHLRASINHGKEVNIECRIKNSTDKICYVAMRGHLITRADETKRFVGTIMDISDKKLLETETEQLKIHQQKEVAKAILQAEANERKRISDALHDSVSQLLYGIKLNVQQVNAGSEHSASLQAVKELLDMAIAETRNLSFQLAPSILNDFGLPATIEEMAKRLSTPVLKIKSKLTGFNNRLDLDIETNIFRIVQELLNNCIKHAEASQVNIEINKNNFIHIKVEDNGKGFNVSKQKKISGGTGLSSIKNKVQLYNGSMEVESESGGGTTVRVVLHLSTC